MNGRTIAGILLTLLLVGGAVAIGVTAYNAGVTQGLVDSGQVVAAPGYPVGPYVGGYGYDRGGFGFFGFLGILLFFFLLIGLFRAVAGGGHGRGGWSKSGWGGPGGPGGPGGWYGHGQWNDRAREFHDELHRTSGQTAQAPTDQDRA